MNEWTKKQTILWMRYCVWWQRSSKYLLVILIFCDAHWVLGTLQKAIRHQESWYDIKMLYWILPKKLTSMMAAWTLGFWNAMATSGLAIIFDMTSSGVSPIWSDKHNIERV